MLFILIEFPLTYGFVLIALLQLNICYQILRKCNLILDGKFMEKYLNVSHFVSNINSRVELVILLCKPQHYTENGPLHVFL